MFSGFHLYLVSSNLTTNEFFKRRELRRSQVRQVSNESSGSITKFASQPCPHTHAYALDSLVANWREVWAPRYKAKIFAVKMAASMRSDHQKAVKSA